MCDIVKLYMAYSIYVPLMDIHTGRNRVPMQNVMSECMHLQNKPMKHEISCVPTLHFALGRRKSFTVTVSVCG